jgi:hypothetical protein
MPVLAQERWTDGRSLGQNWRYSRFYSDLGGIAAIRNLENQQLQNAGMGVSDRCNMVLPSSVSDHIRAIFLCFTPTKYNNPWEQGVLRNEFFFTISHYKTPINHVHMWLDQWIVVDHEISSSFLLDDGGNSSTPSLVVSTSKNLTTLTNNYAIKNSHMCSIFLCIISKSSYWEKKLWRKRKAHSTMKMAHRQILHNHFKQMAKPILHITYIQPIESFCEIALAIFPY